MSEKKLFLLDAMALIYRAYYALIRAPRITSYGKNTNAQFGFTNALLDLINKEKPTHLAVVFDTAAATERHTDFAAYKANRQEAPEDLIAAIPDIKKIIRSFNLPCLEKDGYEADDVIGSLALEAAALGYTVYMVTPDKDFGQIVRENIFIYKPSYQGGGVEILGEKEVCERWNIKTVHQVIDMLALMGDAADNIPGIPGIGEKTAAKLLVEYETVENILANAENIKGAVGVKVMNGKESAIMSKKLATIITNAPVPFHEEDFKLKEWNKDALTEIFQQLEFKTLSKRILGTEPEKPAVSTDLFGNPLKQSNKNIPALPFLEIPLSNEVEVLQEPTVLKTIEQTEHQYHLVQTEHQIAQLIQKLALQKEIAFDTETTNVDANLAELVGMSFCYQSGEAFYVPAPNAMDEVKALLQRFQPLFDNEAITWVGQNIKYDQLVLRWYGFELKGQIFDTMLAHYVIEPEGKHNMDALSSKYLNYQPVSIETLIGKGKNQTSMRDVSLDIIKDYAAEDADITWQLRQQFQPLLDQSEVRQVFEKIENPLVSILVDMEFEGVGVDVPFLNDYSKILEKDIQIAEEKVFAQAGVKFNLGSPKQLGEVLFDHMKLDPSAKKTKTGQYATGEDILQKLRSKHSIVDDILTFRELSKLKSTYVDALPQLIHPKTGRVHTSFNQAVAVTGRLSSTNPNLQNIPIRTERGKEIRRAFVAKDQNHLIVSADYSQIELRIIASISGDESMIRSFKNNEDIHTATAAKVYGVEKEAVTSDMRRAAKAVNFGIIYGQSAFGLAENLGISRTEAKTIIDNYFKEYPSVKKYMDSQINFAREHGYVSTIMGRKRWLKDITSSNQTVRGFAERNAINMPIQGTAADMIKLAMIQVQAALRQTNLNTKMVLQVHDELLFDVPKSELEQAIQLIKNTMQQAMTLPNEVPIIAEAGSGTNWLEAH